MAQIEKENNFSLASIINAVVRIPNVKVDRNTFLSAVFKEVDRELLDTIIEKGPVEAGVTNETLRKKANKVINEMTLYSTGASFVAGLPGGMAMAAAIPADVIQFYASALKLAQEIAYLYGEEELWYAYDIDNEKVHNQLILYCGVMLGASGAAQTVRVLSSALAKQALKKIPQKALTKTFYYPMIKSVVNFFGGTMTKQIFGKGVSQMIPVIGGIVSGGITFATMKPMGERLAKVFHSAHFGYTQEDFNADWNDIITVCENAINEENEKIRNNDDILNKIKQAKAMLTENIITEEEFAAIKEKLISQL